MRRATAGTVQMVLFALLPWRPCCALAAQRVAERGDVMTTTHLLDRLRGRGDGPGPMNPLARVRRYAHDKGGWS